MKYIAVTTAVLGAGAAAAVFGFAAGTAGHTDPAIALTSTSDDYTTAMSDANTAVAKLATQDIVGGNFFGYQQRIQDGLTGGLNGLPGLQEHVVTGADSVSDDATVIHANEALTTALTNLTAAENSIPAIPTDNATLMEELQLPVLLFDEARILTIDYTQVEPAIIGDVFTTVGVEISDGDFGAI